MFNMDLPKLPEPAGRVAYDGGAYEQDWIGYAYAYTDDQMYDYAREAILAYIRSTEEI